MEVLGRGVMRKYLLLICAWMLFVLGIDNLVSDIGELFSRLIGYSEMTFYMGLRWLTCGLSFAGWWMIIRRL